jgi:hypothetical protein
LFSNRAADRFKNGNEHEKRLILQAICSNLFLRDKTLKFEAKKPFACLAKTSKTPLQLGVGDDVRTFNTKKYIVPKLVMEITQALKSDEGREILKNIRTLRQRFEPEVMAKEDAAKARKARVMTRAYKAQGAGASWKMPPQY